MKPVKSWQNLPYFTSEEDEHRFWQEHELDPQLASESLHTPDARESTTVTLRFDPRMVSRIKLVARSRFLNYQSMIKHWLAERLEEELRKMP